MKLSIIQLSDIHISGDRDFILNKQQKMFAAMKSTLINSEQVIIVISGDIANTGQKKEYDLAKTFLAKLETIIKENTAIKDIQYVFVPGNHDCCLPQESDPIRDAVMNSEKDKDTLEKQALVDCFISVQNDYWAFYQSFYGDEEPSKFVSAKKTIAIQDDFNLEFHLYNTALLSARNETVGSLRIPENYFISRNPFDRSVYVISVFHHNTGWLSPNTPKNNKKRFENHLVKESDIVMCGHEHDNNNKVVSDLTTNNSMIYLEGGAFQYNHTSSFNIIEVDTILKNITCHRFEYKTYENPELNRYTEVTDEPIALNKKQGSLRVKQSYEDEIMRFNLPIKISGRPDITLNDIYVYPDLDPILDSIDTFGQYIDASNLSTSWIDGKTVILEGESQCGKTSLLYMIYAATYKRGKYPLLIKGSDIKSEHIASVIEKAYKQQYENTVPYEVFKQLESKDKILLIDNIHSSSINNETRKSIITSLESHFSTIITTTKDSLNFHNINYSSKTGDDLKHYNILSFGSVKRNELIEKWVRLRSNMQSIDASIFESQVKLLFDQLSNLLGEQFITPYPVFLLSLLQSLSNAAEPINIEQTYYAYCYSSLILCSIQSTGVDSDTQKEFLNFLTEFAYHLYQKGYTHIKRGEINEFFDKYKEENVYKNTLDGTLKKLCEANIIREIEMDVFGFSYKYIYYYLVAQKISEFVYTEDGQKIVNDLCSEIYNERSANILIFLVYHTKNQDLIESLLITSMDTFSDYQPITMANDDGFMKKVGNMLSNIKNNVLIADVDPHKEREKTLKLSDENKRHLPKKSAEEEIQELENLKKDKDLRDIVQTIRSIRILGQIIKNQKSSIGKTNISSILEEAYLSCFRMISFYSHYLEKEEDDIVRTVLEGNANNPNITKEVVQDKVQKFLSSLLYRICLGSFSTLSLSVGTPNLEEEYDKIAQKLGTPAAKLISFTIKSFYGPLKVTELEDLIKEFSGNHLATHILKARALHYVYNNTVDYKQKQRIGQICNMKLLNSAEVQHQQKR